MTISNVINASIDSIVMLIHSDWKIELRSNHYHYAYQFAKLYPVIFVQPDLNEERFYYESTELENVTILHVYNSYCSELQSDLIASALNMKRILSPLLWIYNPQFIDFITKIYSTYKVYHATEDYFSSDYPISVTDALLDDVIQTLGIVDDIVCVSIGVMDSILKRNVKWKDKTRVLANDCDYDLYCNKFLDDPSVKNRSKIALYHGNIFNKIDFELLNNVVRRMPEWTFQFCGPIVAVCEEWGQFANHKNVEYLGVLTSEQLKERAYKATVGIIPFRSSDYKIKSTLPFQVFEYVACGLPVVSTTVDALRCYEDVFLFADSVDSFVKQILLAEILSTDKTFINNATTLAYEHLTDKNFSKVISGINRKIERRHVNVPDKLNILVLYEYKSLRVNTVKDHLDSFAKFSAHHVFYASATEDNNTVPNLSSFDVVVIHYSLRLSVNDGNWTVSESAKKLLKHYSGLKVAFIQDEYDETNVAITWLQDLGIHVVFTCVPDRYVRQVYSSQALPNVHFVHNLTGYVPQNLIEFPVRPLTEREIIIAYRGRCLPYWYGELGQEKELIGKRMKEICLARGLKQDIEWDETKRIYGHDWYKFLASSQATLGTESGSNLIDFDGELCKKVTNYLESHPTASYQEIFTLFLQHHEGQVQMNQISPKIFEAICLYTALILFEGDYSGILEPNKHYIPLKKNFSNIDEVLNKVSDAKYLVELTDNAYQDIIMSGKYSYRSFVGLFDKTISNHLAKSRQIKINFANKEAYNEVIVQGCANRVNGQEENQSIEYKSYIFILSFWVLKKLSKVSWLVGLKLIVTRYIKIFNPVLRKIKSRLIEYT